jgi:hypothetical protein
VNRCSLRQSFVKLVAAFCVAAFIATLGPSAALASSWSAPRNIGMGSLAAVSCPSESFCVAVSGAEAKTYNGRSWSAVTFIDTAGDGVSAVSCSSPSFCIAVGGGMNAFAYNGHSWSMLASIAYTNLIPFGMSDGLESVSCVSASFCVATDGWGNAFVYNGESWSVSRISYSGITSGSAVSCSSSSFCTLITNYEGGNDGVFSANYDGISWTNAPYINVGYSHSGASTVSCVSPSFCAAVGDGGTSIYSGSSWTPTPITNSQFNSVSCATASFCVAVDSAGNAYTYNGTSWSAAARIDSSSEPISISCSSASFCVVVAEALSGHYSDYAVTYSTAMSSPTHHTKRKRKHHRHLVRGIQLLS